MLAPTFKTTSVLLIGALLSFVASAQPSKPVRPLVVNHVSVVNVAVGTVLKDMAVIIRGQRILSIQSAQKRVWPGRAHVIDASGQFLIPGLWDMHVHLIFGDWLPRDEHIALPLLVANGVTGVRDMGGDLPALKQWRTNIDSGALLGPRLFIAGPMLDGPVPRFPSSAPVRDAADARRVVAELQHQGVDFIKVQSLIPREGYFAAAEKARKSGISFVGHVPDAVRASEAVLAGQKSIEHFTGIFEGCSTIEEELIKGPKSVGRNVSTYDPERARQLIALIAKHQTWQVPTLVWERSQWLIDDIDLRGDPLVKYAPRAWVARTWPMFTAAILKDMDTDPLPIRKRFVQIELDMTLAMYRAGVPFMAGTDTAAGVHVFPGFSLHDELALFVQAGLTPLQALQTATLNPARFMGVLLISEPLHPASWLTWCSSTAIRWTKSRIHARFERLFLPVAIFQGTIWMGYCIQWNRRRRRPNNGIRIHRTRDMKIPQLIAAVCLVVVGGVLGLRAAEVPPSRLLVDATQAPTGLLRSRMTFAASAGTLTLAYPKWIPGEHVPGGPLSQVVRLAFSANGKPLRWHRDDLDIYLFHVEVPSGVSEVVADMEFACVIGAEGFQSDICTSYDQLAINWWLVVLYPPDKPNDQNLLTASLVLPEGWRLSTALPVESRILDKRTISFKTVSLKTLVDSPLIAGEHLRTLPLGGCSPVELNLSTESAAGLAISPEQVSHFSRMVAETEAVFDGPRYPHYNLMLSLGDSIDHYTLEHLQSSDNRLPASGLRDPRILLTTASMIPHEYIHAWNGKYRTPTGLDVRTYQDPMRSSLYLGV